MHALWACATALALTACSTARPWVNPPLTGEAQWAAGITRPLPEVASSAPDHAIIAAVTLSGGGARAAAFGLGVLEELKATRFELQGRATTLLDEVNLISGVSGGSVLAAYYAAFGDEVFTRFGRDFLLVDFQTSLVRDILSPATLYHLTSPWWGRSDTLALRFDALFRGITFGELRARRPLTRLLVTATDLTTGAPFEFTPQQFAVICSDLDRVPLSVAVAASSAVPMLLSPVTLRNYAGTCPFAAPAADPAPADRNLSARLLQRIAESYRDAGERPYLHLVDGGLADNLGVRGLVDHTMAGGSLDKSFGTRPEGSVHQIVLVSVNSERDAGERIDRTDRVPGMVQVLDALVFGAGSRFAEETTAMVDDQARRLREQLHAARGRPGSPFAADAELHVITVSLRSLRDADLLRVPTAFQILPVQVNELQAAGRTALRDSPEFQRLRASLGSGAVDDCASPKCDRTATDP
ncbi:patatin-like phospholipase family protein [Ramlibacter monticola]